MSVALGAAGMHVFREMLAENDQAGRRITLGADEVVAISEVHRVAGRDAFSVFDAAINSGPGRAAKWLQACVGVEPDGGIGPKTLAAVAAFDPRELVEDYAKRRLSFLMDLPHWGTFGKGWSRRVAEVQSAATNMTA